MKLVSHANRSKLTADRMDTSAVTVEVQDVQGWLVSTASNKMRFRLTGPGKIIGFGNGDPSCHKSDRPNVTTPSAFNGLCLALVQTKEHEETIQVEASADGLESSALVIESRAAIR